MPIGFKVPRSICRWCVDVAVFYVPPQSVPNRNAILRTRFSLSAVLALRFQSQAGPDPHDSSSSEPESSRSGGQRSYQPLWKRKGEGVFRCALVWLCGRASRRTTSSCQLAPNSLMQGCLGRYNNTQTSPHLSTGTQMHPCGVAKPLRASVVSLAFRTSLLCAPHVAIRLPPQGRDLGNVYLVK